MKVTDGVENATGDSSATTTSKLVFDNAAPSSKDPSEEKNGNNNGTDCGTSCGEQTHNHGELNGDSMNGLGVQTPPTTPLSKSTVERQETTDDTSLVNGSDQSVKQDGDGKVATVNGVNKSESDGSEKGETEEKTEGTEDVFYVHDAGLTIKIEIGRAHV